MLNMMEHFILKGDNDALRNFSHFNYAAEPFVNQLKSTNDPRGKFILANFPDPGNVAATPNPDTVLANQFGVPIGVTDQILQPVLLTEVRGERDLTIHSLMYGQWPPRHAPEFWVTYAQTSLLLAEAAKRGWIPGGDATAKTYYENGIMADMATYTLSIREPLLFLLRK